MKSWLSTLLAVFCCCSAGAQALSGLNGIDNPVVSLRENPAFAFIEDRGQINFFTATGSVGGNSILFKSSALGFLTNGKISPQNGYTKNTNGDQKMFYGNVELMGPGAIIRIRRRYYFGVSTGLRYLVNSDNLDSKVFNLLGAKPAGTVAANDTFKINNYSSTAQVFSELNLTYAGFLHETEDYKLVAAVTVKVLDGISAAGLGIPTASFNTENNDGMAHNVNGTANIAFTPYSNKWLVTNDPFNALRMPTNNLGVGADLGLAYYMNPNDAMTIKHGYMARLAVSVTDIGSISYSSSSTTAGYDIANKTINYRGLDNNTGVTFGDRIFNNYLVDTVATAKGNMKRFRVGLPTALHFNGDFKIKGSLFLNANVLVNLRTPSANTFSNHYISTVSVTPRYNFGKFGVSLPLSMNIEKQFYVGAVIYAGPVFVGSGAMYPMFFSNSYNNANLYFGLSLRLKPRRQTYKEMMMM